LLGPDLLVEVVQVPGLKTVHFEPPDVNAIKLFFSVTDPSTIGLLISKLLQASLILLLAVKVLPVTSVINKKMHER
jgi:hypothetical protein